MGQKRGQVGIKEACHFLHCPLILESRSRGKQISFIQLANVNISQTTPQIQRAEAFTLRIQRAEAFTLRIHRAGPYTFDQDRA